MVKHIVTILLACSALAWSGDAPTEENSRGEQPVLVFHRYSLDLKVNDPIPRLRLYASGRARIHLPEPYRDAGDYELDLGPTAVSEVLAEARAAGLGRIRPGELAEQAEQALARLPETGIHVYRSETVVTELRLAADGESLGPPLVVDDLQWTAGRVPDVPALQSLAALERRLMALAGRSDRVRSSLARRSDEARP